MSPLPLLATKIPRRSSHFLPQCTATILALFLLGSPTSRASVSNQFIRLTTYPTGGTPAKIVTADFNRDGKADIVVLNSNRVLSILLGNGNGTFAAPKTIATLPANSAGFPALMVAGDFNGDGNPDLAVLPSPGNVVKVFLGHGDGTFAAPVSIADGLPSAGDLATGDFNNDDRADIVVTNSTSVALLLGKSGGIFAKPIVTKTSLTAPDHLVLALGDVNRDSHLDITANDQGGDFQVLLGTGSGTFHLKSVFSYNLLPPYEIAIADFSGDGNPDIAVGMGSVLPQFVAGQVCFLFGYGDGTFDLNTPRCYYDPKDSFDEMLATNLNGKPGLLFPSDPMVVELNNGSGVLSKTSYAVGGPVALGDFNGDGRQDIAVGNSNGVQVLLNVESGALHAPVSLSGVGIPFNFYTAMNSTDFNGDGYADLVLLEAYDGHTGWVPSIVVWLGGPRNQFTSSGIGLPYDAVGAFPPAIGDFNHDGFLDFAIGASVFNVDTNQSYAQVLLGDGKGHFQFPTQGPEPDLTTNFFAAGDFNRDGNADLASLDGSILSILIGKGDGTFAPAVTYAVGANPVFVLQRDVNRDGKLDLVVVNQDSNDISVLLGNGDGTFQAQKTFAAGKAPVAAVTGDFNRDGKIDIAVASSAGLSVLLGNGNGTFQPQKTYSAAGPLTGIVQASVRQDGIGYLIGVDSASKRFVVLPGVGDGTFGAPVVFPIDRVPTSIVAGDFNHDGATDIALMGGGIVDVFFNQGGDYVALASSSSKPKPNQSVTFTAHVTASYGESGSPTGKVTFKDGTHVLGNAYLNAGVAKITIQLTAGTHQIMAQYGGNTTFNPNHSSTLTLVVGP